ncbi:MAG: aspartate--tRNA ligase [Candidatus Paceibacterota bacterium]|nr:MAG: aspartate--tRNA ligase [Candidatus Paceibacterota bacterium]
MERIKISSLKEKVGHEVKVLGWINARRDHGKLIFFDLRDESGKVQMVSLPQNQDTHKLADSLRDEWVVEIKGKANKRPEKMVNSEEELGHIEIEISEIKVLNEAQTPPFNLQDSGYDINEEIRMKYRYLDLRRPRMQKNIRNRHKIIKFFRDYLDTEGFVEVETPILTKSTPEGARDYIVPSRTYPGKFYALPQSPQQYKQLLMASGIEKYFQVAKCMRDEDTRGDRQAEFTQLDIEMSFVDQEKILDLVENMFSKMVNKIYPEKTFTESPWPRINYDEAMEKYNSDKPDIRKNKNDPNELGFVWVLNFPLFEKDLENGHFAPSHHMFTAPKEEDLQKLENDPADARSYQHDLALNGFEVAGGSIRIHDPKIQEKIFNLIGFDEKQKKYFEHMLDAFTFGIPPHGGIASGLDRLIAVLENESSIREVIAFPKTGEGRDLTMGAPSEIEQNQLKDLKIKTG